MSRPKAVELHGMRFCGCPKCEACDWSPADESFPAGCARTVAEYVEVCQDCRAEAEKKPCEGCGAEAGEGCAPMSECEASLR